MSSTDRTEDEGTNDLSQRQQTDEEEDETTQDQDSPQNAEERIEVELGEPFTPNTEEIQTAQETSNSNSPTQSESKKRQLIRRTSSSIIENTSNNPGKIRKLSKENCAVVRPNNTIPFTDAHPRHPQDSTRTWNTVEEFWPSTNTTQTTTTVWNNHWIQQSEPLNNGTFGQKSTFRSHGKFQPVMYQSTGIPFQLGAPILIDVRLATQSTGTTMLFQSLQKHTGVSHRPKVFDAFGNGFYTCARPITISGFRNLPISYLDNVALDSSQHDPDEEERRRADEYERIRKNEDERRRILFQ